MRPCSRPTRAGRAACLSAIALTGVCLLTGSAAAQTTVQTTLTPDTIAPGNVTRMQLIMQNSGSPAKDTALTMTLPGGVTLATGTTPTTDCKNATVTGSGQTITMSGGRLGNGASCAVIADVTSATAGPHTLSGATFSYTQGNTPATAAAQDTTLTVDATRHAFGVVFDPSSATVGALLTLRLTLDATAATTGSALLAQQLPPGLTFTGAPMTSTCTGDLIAPPAGSDTFSFNNVLLQAGTTCAVELEVRADTAGTHLLRTGELSVFAPPNPQRSSGYAVAHVDVVQEPLQLTAQVVEPTTIPGGAATLRLTLRNANRGVDLQNLGFVVDLNAALAGLVASSLPAAPCGMTSTLSGTGALTFAGGTLPSGAQCTLDIPLTIPAGAPTGVYTITTSGVTGADASGRSYQGGPASAVLRVQGGPATTVTFTPDTVSPGAATSLDITLTNPTMTPLTNITLTADVSSALPGAALTPPAAGACGGGSTTQLLQNPTTGTSLLIQNASLDPGASCTMTFGVQLAERSPAGIHTFQTSAPTATSAGATATGVAGSAALTILPTPRLRVDTVPASPSAGAAVTLTYTIEHSAEASAALTGITFTDALDSLVPGLVANNLPLSDACGVGAQVTGTSTITLTGGSLQPGTSCTFSITGTLPADTSPGTYNSATSTIAATYSGAPVTGAAATSTVTVAGVTLEADFINDPVIPGATTTLEFTLTNRTTKDATGLVFTANLNNALNGLVAVGLPASDVCGTGSQATGTNFLIVQNASLPAGASCTIQITVQLPANAQYNEYALVSSALTGTLSDANGSAMITAPAANASLRVASPLLADLVGGAPARPGQTTTLELTLYNNDPTSDVQNLATTIDLGAALPGAQVMGLPVSGVCGNGAQLSGADVVTLTGGSLAANTSCTIVLSLQLPADLPLRDSTTVQTSTVSGTRGGLTITADPATGVLRHQLMTFTRSFDAPTITGDTTQLTYTLTNHNASVALADFGMVDDLDSALPGLSATGDQLGACGPDSTLTTGPKVVLRNGNIPAGSSCIFTVVVAVPNDAPIGAHPSTSGPIQHTNSTLAEGATATLTVLPRPPILGAALDPTSVETGATSTLTITLDNTHSQRPASTLAMELVLPVGLRWSDPPTLTTTCAGTLAPRGPARADFQATTIDPGTTCTLTLLITGDMAGEHTITVGPLTSDAGVSPSIQTTLTLTAAPEPDMGMPDMGADMGMPDMGDDMGDDMGADMDTPDMSADMGADMGADMDSGGDSVEGGGCACRTTPGTPSPALPAGLGLLLGALAYTRRTRRR